MSHQKTLDGLKPVCICKGIRKKSFVAHLERGIRSVAGLQKATGAGSGSCQGRRCTPRIEDILKDA